MLRTGAVGVVFGFLVLLSPWFVMLGRSSAAFGAESFTIYSINKPSRIDQINIHRGLCMKTNPEVVCKVVINKLSRFGLDAFMRVSQTFEPKFLFLEGDIDPTRSTRRVGSLLIVTGVLALIKISRSKNAGKWIVILVLTSLPAILIENEYHTTARIGTLLLISWLGAAGAVQLIWQHRWAVIFVCAVLLVWEFGTFWLDLNYVYPTRVV